ncbi:MAG: hypothetical protein ABI729_01215 [Chitinophagales bacterium]
MDIKNKINAAASFCYGISSRIRIAVCCNVFAWAILFSSCSNTKQLAVGEELYTKGKIELDQSSKKIATKDVISSLESVMVPVPNKKFLGARLKLAIYNRVKYFFRK